MRPSRNSNIDYSIWLSKKILHALISHCMLERVTDFILKRIPSHKINCFGKNSLLFSSAPYYVLLSIMVIGVSLFELTRNAYLLLFIIYGILPLVDELVTLDTRNPTPEQARRMSEQLRYQIPLYATVAVDWMIFFYAMHVYSTTDLTLPSFFSLIGFAIVVSNLNAAQFAVSHEILHKPGWRRIVGTLHMLKTLNMHFTYEHIFGHHRKVATPEDPASSRKNQNVYQFFIRSYFGAYTSVYYMEKQSGKPVYRNATVLSILSSLVFCAALLKIYGTNAFAFYLFQVAGAVFFLEVINFIEHYGLSRKKLPDGQYEKVSIKHSWNAPHRFSNYLFFKLQRHSDHHENAMKPYQTLLTLEQSPHLPHGYIVMTVMALFPEIFKKIMNPVVDSYNNQTHDNTQEMRAIHEQAVDQTKTFIIQVSLCVGALFVGSCLWIK